MSLHCSDDPGADTLRPDEFMFQQFRMHSRILTSRERHHYVMLSGGANVYPMSPVWSELLHAELDTHLSYGWYTSENGFPTVQRGAVIWENFAASDGRPYSYPLGRASCITLGASQAVAAVFDYVSTTVRRPTALLLGYNYGLFDRLAQFYSIDTRELFDDSTPLSRTLPPASEVLSELARRSRPLLVIATPNNPSGEQYTFDELVAILRTAAGRGGVVLLDRVGQMPIAQESAWLNIGRAVLAAEATDACAIVNSFSKTDGVPGFRLGYLVAPPRILAHAGQFQHRTTMNPPSLPVLAPFFSFIARCIWAGRRWRSLSEEDLQRFAVFARRVLLHTTAIPPRRSLMMVERFFDNAELELNCRRYFEYQAALGRAVCDNRTYLLQRLANEITAVTPLSAGFNFMIQVDRFRRHPEAGVCERVFASTGVALLTESCFARRPRSSGNFWIRISLAMPRWRFRNAVERLADFVSRF